MLDYKSFTVNPAFSDLKEIVSDLKSHGQHYIPVVDVGIKVSLDVVSYMLICSTLNS